MKIKLDDKHYLNSDIYCYWITVEKASKNGKAYEQRVSGYFRRLEEAVDNYVDNRIRSSETESIKELTKLVKDIKRTVKGWKKNGLHES